MTSLRTYILALTALLPYAAPAAAQVSLAPTFVFVDNAERVGSVVVNNGSTHVQEVIIDYEFGYPSADSSGHRYIEYDDREAAAKYDLSGWIRSFPQRFRIEPGRRQVVRMLVQPPADLADGVYWTRMTVTSTESAARPSSDAAGASARLDLRLKQVIPVVFRKGFAETGVRIAELLIESGARGTDLRAIVVRDGDVPFIGSVTLNLFDGEGGLIKEISTSTEVYYTSATHFHLSADEVPPGAYVAELKLVPYRRDVPVRSLPAMKPVAQRFSIDIAAPAPAVADGW